ncbi:splicing regulator SDE2 [Ochotona princeps]|uniref:splicing regulator SDE2 n=1 Tax=Ochotona princeps TaxID=9978 RepID=UPI002714E345|nr:splicing regulator SDE2 [Ochotona princeps]
MAEAVVLVWVRGPGFGCRTVQCRSTQCSVQDFIHRLCQDRDVPVEYFYVKCNGTLVNARDTVQHGAVYSLEPRLCGGKGGFGSMLRALGAQIEKTTNREACRDLSGRRLRDVNHEKAMAEWVKQQAEREAEKEQKRLGRLQRKLAEPKHCFTSPDYQQQCHEMAERLEDSVLKGMQAASSKLVSAEIGENRKRFNQSKAERGASAKKRKCFWSGLEGLVAAEGSSSGSSDDDSEEEPSTSTVGACAPKDSSDVEMADAFPSGSQGARVLSTDFASPEKPQIVGPDSGQIASGDLRVELGEAPVQVHVEREMAAETQESLERKETETQEPTEGQMARAGSDTETKETTEGIRAVTGTPGEDQENVAAANLEESQLANKVLGPETLDLLAFSSAAELESLGLEKLKSELMALGLKCGGTLQERASRLFAVRGLAREHIDPALFAKPVKAKKK